MGGEGEPSPIVLCVMFADGTLGNFYVGTAVFCLLGLEFSCFNFLFATANMNTYSYSLGNSTVKVNCINSVLASITELHLCRIVSYIQLTL